MDFDSAETLFRPDNVVDWLIGQGKSLLQQRKTLEETIHVGADQLWRQPTREGLYAASLLLHTPPSRQIAKRIRPELGTSSWDVALAWHDQGSFLLWRLHRDVLHPFYLRALQEYQHALRQGTIDIRLQAALWQYTQAAEHCHAWVLRFHLRWFLDSPPRAELALALGTQWLGWMIQARAFALMEQPETPVTFPWQEILPLYFCLRRRNAGEELSKFQHQIATAWLFTRSVDDTFYGQQLFTLLRMLEEMAGFVRLSPQATSDTPILCLSGQRVQRVNRTPVRENDSAQILSQLPRFQRPAPRPLYFGLGACLAALSQNAAGQLHTILHENSSHHEIAFIIRHLHQRWGGKAIKKLATHDALSPDPVNIYHGLEACAETIHRYDIQVLTKASEVSYTEEELLRPETSEEQVMQTPDNFLQPVGHEHRHRARAHFADDISIIGTRIKVQHGLSWCRAGALVLLPVDSGTSSWALGMVRWSRPDHLHQAAPSPAPAEQSHDTLSPDNKPVDLLRPLKPKENSFGLHTYDKDLLWIAFLGLNAERVSVRVSSDDTRTRMEEPELAIYLRPEESNDNQHILIQANRLKPWKYCAIQGDRGESFELQIIEELERGLGWNAYRCKLPSRAKYTPHENHAYAPPAAENEQPGLTFQ